VTDHLIHLPSNFRYVYQFQSGKSQYRCVEACLAMAGQIAYPTRYADPVALMDEIYTQYIGADTSSDTKGTNAQQAIAWLTSQHIGHMALDVSDPNALHAQLQEMNLAGVPQLLTIGNESFLHDAKTGNILHNWSSALNQGSHTMLRVGYSDNEAWGYYYEPAAAPNFAEPVAIPWSDFLQGGIVGCIAIFPSGMNEYPPKPKPTFDKSAAVSGIHSVLTALEGIKLAVTELETNINNL